MKNYLQAGMLCLLIAGAFSSCDRMGSLLTFTLSGRAVGSNEKTESKEVQKVRAALYHDAQLARTMPLKQFARHMKMRHTFYKRYRLQHQDEFVKINVNGNEIRIVTLKGRVKMAYQE